MFPALERDNGHVFMRDDRTTGRGSQPNIVAASPPLARAIAVGIALFVSLRPSPAAALKPEAAAAFDGYIASVESRMASDYALNHFLAVDRLPASRCRDACAQMRQGVPWVDSVPIRESGHPVSVPGGMIHHWVGSVFIPGASLTAVLSVLEDYDRHQEIYKPRMRRSRLISREGDRARVHLVLYNKSIVTVFLSADFLATDTRFSPARYQIALRSAHIAELSDPETPNEREMSPGSDHGYLWRFNSYWRLEEKDGGVYLQNESVALTRSVPAILAWLFNPFIKDLPRDILLQLLTSTRDAVLKTTSLRRVD